MLCIEVKKGKMYMHHYEVIESSYLRKGNEHENKDENQHRNQDENYSRKQDIIIFGIKKNECTESKQK